jgi:probable F420-dependent oxidoreductase
MHLGYSTLNNVHINRPDDLARALEERGFESLFVGEHSHIPASGQSPHHAGGKVPETYKHVADPFVSLGMAAVVTRKLKLGLGVMLVLERDVFETAKAVATLDVLSGGRVIAGIGVGWNREEFENVARMSWAKRYSGMRDCVRAMQALWTQEVASHQGEWYKFARVWSYPKPLQKPWPPLLVGVAGKAGIPHAAEWGDGWFPIDLGGKDIAPKLERFRQSVREAGRNPDKVKVTILSFGETGLDRLKRYRDLGVERAVVHGGPEEERDILAKLDKYAAMIPHLK